MEDGNHDIEDDIFERNINEIDVRETPRWEMSEEEADVENEQTLNHVPVNKQVKHLPNSERSGFNGLVVRRSSAGPTTKPSTSVHSSGKAAVDMLPFGQRPADARCITTNYPLPVHQNGIAIPPNMASNKSQEIIENGPTWVDDEQDSVKDFGGPYRKQEAKYMERTNEAIYNRAAEEHIRQPNPYEEEDEDSVKDFGGNSQAISRLPSDENICLSPPWIEEEEGAVTEEDKVVLVDQKDTHEAGNYKIDEVISQAKIRADFGTRSQHWQVEEALDFTKNFADESSLENSRRPSSEDISLTPPWIDNDKDSSVKDYGDQELNSNVTIPDTPHLASNVPVTHGIPSVANVPLPGPPSTSTDPQTGSNPFSTNPPNLGTRPQRRVTPPGQSSNWNNSRDIPSPSVSTRPLQQRTYEGGYHNNAIVNASYPSNNLYGPRTSSPRSAFPVIPASRPNGMAHNGRAPRHQAPRHQAPRHYYGLPVSSPQFAPKLGNIRPNMVPNNSSMVPLYTHSPQIPPTSSSITYDGGNPRSSHEDSIRMMIPRQAINRYEGPYYSQPGNWSYQGMLGKHPNAVPNNLQVFPNGYIPPRTAPNFNANGQRNIPAPDMRHYSELPDEELTADSDASPVLSTRCESQSSLAVYCHTPHRDGIETASVVSFASGASTHQDLDSKIDQVRNLLAVIDTRDTKEMAQTLFSLSNSKENCQAMRQSGCLPLLIQLQHEDKLKDPRVGHEVRLRAAQTMRNIISSGLEDRKGRRELRVLKLLEVLRGYCVEFRYLGKAPSKERALEQALAAVMKLSFEEEHRAALGDLGGVEAIGEFLQLNHAAKRQETDSPGTSLCKYASMTLTNMTFGNTRNKKMLGNALGIVKALLGHLTVLNDEDLIQVSASVLRNLSCKSDERSKIVFQECNAVAALITAAQKVSGESALRTILFAVWNLSAHNSENKTQICETAGALAFLVKMLGYKSMNNSLSVVESAGGILRNLSSHVAVKPECRTILRDNGCFQILLVHLRSPSLRVVSNACGILWNLSARCAEDQELLWKLGSVSLLKSLVSSKNKSIAKGAGAAIKNLQNFKSSAAVGQPRDSSSESRKPKGLALETGSPLQARAKENHLVRTSSRSRDMQSLNSFTGSADDVTKDTGRKIAKVKEKSNTGDADPMPGRTKGVRWVDDRTIEKRSGKESVRKTLNHEKKRVEGVSEDQQSVLTSDSRAQTTKELETRDDVGDATTTVAQMNLSEKTRGNRKNDRSHSPKTKMKSNSKKKHVSEQESLEMDCLMSSQDSPRPTNGLSTKEGSANLRRNVYSDAQRSDGLEMISGRFMIGGKQISVKTKEASEGHAGQDDTLVDHGEDSELPRSETSEDDALRGAAVVGKSNVKSARVKSGYDSAEETSMVLTKKTVDLSLQRCQCPEETQVWVKRSKRCERCQKRRVSHSSESTGGSRRSSYESLSSSNRQLNRKEPATNGTGYVTTL